MEPILKIAVHEIVANQLRRAIHRGDYMPGDRLPSERDLATRLEVSRVTLREAIRMLEAEGYVVSRRGPKGGHTVTALSEPAGRMHARLRADRHNIVNLMEFRRVNECLAARLAAKLRSEEDLRKIRTAIEDLKAAENNPRFRKADADFHLAVAMACRNPFVERAIVDAREAIFFGLYGDLTYKMVLHTTLASHQDIFKAIHDRRSDRAEQAMARHIAVALKEIQYSLTVEQT